MFRWDRCPHRMAADRRIRWPRSSRWSGSTSRRYCSMRDGTRARPRTSSAFRRRRCTGRFANSGCVVRTSVEADAMKILVIEDDPTVGQYVKRGLEEQRWGVDLVTDGEEGESRAAAEQYDLVVLDMRLPGRSGMEVLRAIRARGFERPVLVLTAQDAVDAKVEAFRAGADDYVTKPFAFEELLARVEALARRPRAIASATLRVGDLELDQTTHEVRRGGEPIELTPKEFTVLEYLMRHTGRVMSRTLITEYAWGYHFDPGTNIVDVVINHLRKKIDAKHERKLLTTVRGVGYVVKS